MAQYGFVIEKECDFRGGIQPFANVYHYKGPALAGGAENLLVDEIVGIEKNLHSTAVRFKYARVWSSGGTKEQNQMLFEKVLTGTGTGSVPSEHDRERAILMQWPAGRSVTGKPVYLRKWFHTCGNCAGVTFAAAEYAQQLALSDTKRSTIAAEANKLRIIGLADEYLLVAESGREHTGPGNIHKWLEHRQLGDQWR